MLFLRESYFYSNPMLPLEIVRKAPHTGNKFANLESAFAVVDPYDIARVETEALNSLNSTGGFFSKDQAEPW